MRPRLFYACTLVAAGRAVACAPQPPNSHARGPFGPTSCAGVLRADSAVYDSAQVTEQPVIHTGPPIQYPPAARQRGIQGRVVIAVTVEANGRVDPTSVAAVQSVGPAPAARSV